MYRFPLSAFNTFTDRDRQIAAFHALLASEVDSQVLIFTGLSGNGKTFLVDYLRARVLPEGAPHALLDFETQSDLGHDAVALVNGLLPLLAPLPPRARREHRTALRELCADYNTARAALMGQWTIHQEARGADGAQMEVTQDVDVGAQARVVAQQVEALLRDFRREVADVLCDLAGQVRQPGQVRVLFLDGYEFLRRGNARYEVWVWGLLCALLGVLPGLRVVVAGREAPRVALPALPAELEKFAAAESAAYLQARGIVDAQYQAALHTLTDGHPLLLDMAANLATGDAPLSLHEVETAPTVAQGRRPVTDWLYARILDRMPVEHRPLAEIAALLRRFDEDVMAALLPDSGETLHATSLLRAFTQTYPTWLRQHPSGGWGVHDLVGRARAAALRQQGPDTMRDFHHRAAAVWQARWERAARPDDLAEALYHAFWVDEAAAAAAWEQAVQEHTLVAGWDDWRTVVRVPADLRLVEKPLDRQRAADMAYRRARWHYYVAEWDAATEACDQALGLFRAVGDRLGEANTLQAIGDVQRFRDENDAALASYGAALGLFRAVGDRLGEANTLKAIGDVQQFRKELDAALASYGAALGLFRAVGSRLGEANTLQSLGNMHLAQGEVEEASRTFDQALDLYRQVGARVGQANIYWNFGLHLAQNGQLQQAEPLLAQALALAQVFAPGHSITEHWGQVLAQVRAALSTNSLPDHENS